MNTNKKVSNLLINIGKVRDILEEGDLNKIERNTFFIVKTSNDVIRHVKKYITDDLHQTDFNSEDVRALADDLFDISDKCIKMRYSNLYKWLTNDKAITMERFNAMCDKMHYSYYFDKELRNTANELSFWAITMWMWSQSEYRLPIMEQITRCIIEYK